MIKFHGNVAGLDDFDDDKFNHHDNDSGDCDFELDARQFHGNARGPYDVDDENYDHDDAFDTRNFHDDAVGLKDIMRNSLV